MRRLGFILVCIFGLQGCLAFKIKHCWAPGVCTTAESRREFESGMRFVYVNPETGERVEFVTDGAVTTKTIGEETALEAVRLLDRRLPTLEKPQ